MPLDDRAGASMLDHRLVAGTFLVAFLVWFVAYEKCFAAGYAGKDSHRHAPVIVGGDGVSQ
jgi:hypothetical protein